MSTASSKSIPVQSAERIQVVDVLRGFAILGILIFNMRSFAGLSFFAGNYPDLLDKIIVILTDFFVQAKFYSLFSFLFGWGMAVQMRRAEVRGTQFLPAYFRRLVILLLFGALHTVFLWTGDILFMYAIIGLMMLGIFRNSKPRTLLIAVGLLLLSRVVMALPGAVMDSTREWCRGVSLCFAPETDLPQSLYATGTYWEVTKLRFQGLSSGLFWFPCYIGSVFAMMLLGLYTGKRRLFADFDQHRTLFRRVMWIGLVVGVLLNGVFTYLSTVPFQSPYFSLIRIGSRTLGAPALTLFYITGITLLYQKSAWRERLAPLGRAGRMALTNYISHSVLLTFVYYGYGFGLYGITDPTFGLIFTIIIYRLQLQLSTWWFEHYKFGPLEWLWRRLAYNIRLPFSVTSEQGFSEVSAVQIKQRRLILISAAILLSIPLAIILIKNSGSDPQAPLPPQPTQVEDQLQEQDLPKDIPDDGMSYEFQLALSGMGRSFQDGRGEFWDLMELVEDFDAESALEVVDALGQEEYQGRYAGTPGGQAAAEYLADKFKDYGLFPVGGEGNYFQPFPTRGVVLENEPLLEISKPDGSSQSAYGLYQEYQPVLGHYAGGASGAGNAVWVVSCSESDFSQLDLVGEIAVCKAGDIEDQARLAAKNGAAGLLLLTDESVQPPARRGSLTESWIPDPIPVFLIYEQVASDLLAESDYSVRDLSILYKPLELETRVEMEVSTVPACQEEDCSGRNLLGVFPGWDPEYNDQVIILSANYDGLGSAPNGLVWPGANWNGSGVGVLLEIARGWQDADYLPRATVLFALWDAEEQDSLGVKYFLEHPIYPLENTLALIHLDGVGSGSDQLMITGARFEGQVEAAADYLGLISSREETPDRITNLFQEAQIPFIGLSWEGAEEGADLPGDDLDSIKPAGLSLAGQVTEYLALQLGDLSLRISDLLESRCAALIADDQPAFLESATEANQVGETSWFSEVRELNPTDCSSSVTDLLVLGNAASAEVEIQLSYPSEEDQEDETLQIQLAGKFQNSPDGWLWDGPDLTPSGRTSLGSTAVRVYYNQNISEEVDQIAEFAVREYDQITKTLSLSSQLDARIYLYSTREQLKADTLPTSRGSYQQWIGLDTLKFSNNPLNDQDNYRAALVGLMLQNHGITSANFSWLWDGLPLLLAEDHEGVLLQSDNLDRFRDQLAEGEIPSTRVASWAAVEYLRQTEGWAGLGLLISGLEQACQEAACDSEEGADQALLTALGMDQGTFDSAWGEYWLERLDQAQAEVDSNLESRTQAVLDGELNAFLESVDPDVPNLLQEEKDWFAANSDYPLESFRLTAEPIAILENGGLIASMTMEYQLQGIAGYQGRGSIPLDVVFNQGEEGLLWAGPVFDTLENDLVQVRFPEGFEEEAADTLAKASPIYQELSRALGLEDPEPLTINLYLEKPVYEAFITLSYDGPDWDPGWSAPGHSVKILVGDGLEDEFILARHMGRSLLSQMGTQQEWLLNGGSSYLAGDAVGGILENRAAAYLISLDNTIRRDQEFRLDEFPELHQVSEYDYKVGLAQSWDSIRYLAERYGEEALSELLVSGIQTSDLNSALQSAIGISVDEFSANWKESLSKGHFPADDLEVSLDFDPEQALGHIEYLTSSELAGRQAGSPGSLLAADYIKTKFEEYGLVVEEQFFPINYQTYLESPTLEFVINGSAETFLFREDFLVLQPTNVPEGLSGELIWIADRDYPGMDLTGKIAIRNPNQAVEVEIQNAREHGAQALILVGDKNREEDLLARYPFRAVGQEDGFPVYEMTRSGFDRLLDLTGLNKATLDFTVPAVIMEVKANLSMSISPVQYLETSNIIGYLPGEDPDLREELVIIGAHYDHVGDELGVAYRGANDNASGVGVLLEIARLWHSAGYQPQRSVLFIAWGGQEYGEIGSTYYLSNPLYPLDKTRASLQLDAVGNGDGYYLDAYGDRTRDGLLIFDVQKASEVVESRLLIAGVESSPAHSENWLFSPTYLFSSARLDPTSDARPFREAGIATLLFRWKETSEKNLPDSAAFEVLPERIYASGKTITATLMMLTR